MRIVCHVVENVEFFPLAYDIITILHIVQPAITRLMNDRGG